MSGFFWGRLGGLAKEVARANSEVTPSPSSSSQVAHLNLQGDFQYALQNPAFASWLDTRSASINATPPVTLTEEAA